ncbi:fibronectin type III domain-containing protein [Alloactinosynnema sp. L-07]|uniref:fibronectin type III domain-containing protein n=1 Tax=Alloactinosynnema sp. L-07 TaxID=1653480 RepID=UPI0012FBA027|nr:fibronectin type III domain-containing protein [Alloactinosynnema sp. L-07]
MPSSRPNADSPMWLSVVSRARITVALLVAGCLGLVGVAVAGQTSPTPALQFIQVGHWVYNGGLQSVFHVDGSTNQVDAQASVPGAERGSQVVQGPNSGYVVGRTRITVFGKATLTVEDAITPPADERPVAVEVVGGPYLVYRAAGRIVRLSTPPAIIPAGGPLGTPVATSDGTLWVHRTDTGALCELAADVLRLACPAQMATDHRGALAMVGDKPVLMDTTSDTLHEVGADGFGANMPVGVDLPASAQVANSDAGGRLAVFDPDRKRMHLIDTAGLAKDRPVARPVTIDLPPDGRYAGPVASAKTIAIVDETRNEVITYDGHGKKKSSTKVPGSGGSPRLAHGEDKRIYVDGPDGSHVLVVDVDNGSVSTVTVGGDNVPSTGSERDKPTGTSTTAPTSTPSTPTQTPSDTGTPAPTTTTAKPTTKPSPKQATTTPAPRTTTTRPAPPPTVPATPPGAPGAVNAMAGAGSAAVTWTAAAANGAPVTGYVLSWPGGSTTAPGSATSATVSGLTNGTSYVITVAARNSAGTGPGVSAGAVTPRAAASAPTVTASISPGGVASVNWTQADLAGGTLVHYLVTATGQADRQILTGVTQYTEFTSPMTVTVRAITRFGPAGSPTVTGAPGTATLTRPPAPPVVLIAGVATTGPDSIAVTVDVTTGDPGTTCQVGIGAGAELKATARCVGRTTIPVRGVVPGPAGYHHVTVVAINSAGQSNPAVWINVPTPQGTGGGFLILAPLALAITRRKKGADS